VFFSNHVLKHGLKSTFPTVVEDALTVFFILNDR
jgi:hypothetical protein